MSRDQTVVLHDVRWKDYKRILIGRLLETWCIDRDMEVTPFGNWTLEEKKKEAAAKADECDGKFESSRRSRLLPDLDLALLASMLDRDTLTQAVRDFRQALEAAT